ncbi:MAG TPA: bifunctional tetrahydrofolate synthase/dihydrofolate synthase [Xanthomonadales bacterium]|nr:bifunctional tetrahydrofolate synthase/dihydrofolate synthase [Xanthomonadales bacterium]
MTRPLNLQDWLQILEIRHPSSIDLGLDRVGEVWQALGSPRPAPRVFTIAGTNGKGSTVAYIDAMLVAMGFLSATYTSPHVFRYNERVRIAGLEASDEELVWAFDAVEQARGVVGLSYFEHGTLAAFLLMQRAKLDFAVLEVGLGGRLDAVNLVDADCAVITPIGLDHQDYLGPDRESIGREKAGILRRGQTVVVGESDPPASLLAHAGELGVNLRRLGHEFDFERTGEGPRWWSGDQQMTLPAPPLSGPHQWRNLATAVAAVTVTLPEAMHHQDQLASGIRNVRLAGRLQPHPDDPNVLVDVGHNPLAAEVVAHMLEADGQSRVLCVLAMLRDKDAASVVHILDSYVERWYCAGLAGERGRTGADLAQLVSGCSGNPWVAEFDNVEAALQSAHQSAAMQQKILVFGSFLTAGQALHARLNLRDAVAIPSG